MLAELSIGRATQKNVVGAFHQLNKKWTFAGGIGVLTLFVIMSYYSVVGGWVLKYIFAYLAEPGFGNGTVSYQEYFVNFISEPVQPLAWGFVFLVLCIYVVVKGVSEGIERVSKILMPALFILLVACAVRAVTLPGAGEGLSYMLTIKPGSFNRDTLVGALGQAFFSPLRRNGNHGDLWLLCAEKRQPCKERGLHLRSGYAGGISGGFCNYSGCVCYPGCRRPWYGRRLCFYGPA